MRAPHTAVALCVTAVLLCACQKTAPEGSAPPSAAQAVPGTQPGSAANTSVPPADAVVAPAADKPKADPAAGRTNSAMSRKQESSAMPLPGQNNDHSAPLSSAKPASAP